MTHGPSVCPNELPYCTANMKTLQHFYEFDNQSFHHEGGMQQKIDAYYKSKHWARCFTRFSNGGFNGRAFLCNAWIVLETIKCHATYYFAYLP